MELYKRFLLIIVAAACVAGAVCGILIAKDNTERRFLGAQKQLPITEELFSSQNSTLKTQNCISSRTHWYASRGAPSGRRITPQYVNPAFVTAACMGRLSAWVSTRTLSQRALQ